MKSDKAQPLRSRVFAVEMGATLPITRPGHDIDLSGDFCEHLLVRDASNGEVLETYRVLTQMQHKGASCGYAAAAYRPMMMRVQDFPQRNLKHFSARLARA